jgi:uncharacterized membrane protein
MDDLLVALTFVTALGCGLSAGALFAFSSFVMKALARLQPAQGIAAMQSINVVAVTPAFMTALFGTAVACVAGVVWALVDWHDSFGPWLLAGAALYLIGTIGLTMAYHVPRNNALAGGRRHQPRRRSPLATSRTGRGVTTSGSRRASRRPRH